MCLIVFAWQHSSAYPLILAANRDEFHNRPTEAAQWWPGDTMLGGRDLRAGGAWLAVSRDGRFATVTNFREGKPREAKKSRGRLVTDFFSNELDNRGYLESLMRDREHYAGFNVLFGRLGTDPSLHYFSNRSHRGTRITPGVHGLSNGLMDQRWPKTKIALERLQDLIEQDNLSDDNLFAIMTDPRTAPSRQLPKTGVGEKLEKMLSAAFIVSPSYGTRCTTLLYVDAKKNARFVERRYDRAGNHYEQDEFTWTITAPAGADS